MPDQQQLLLPFVRSAYVYTYVSIGEFWAFVIGWNIILEHMIGEDTVKTSKGIYNL